MAADVSPPNPLLVVQGMLCLHSQHILHRDLKSPNLLVDAGWRVKVRWGWWCASIFWDCAGKVALPAALLSPSYCTSRAAHFASSHLCLQLCDFNLSSLLDATRSHSSSVGGGMLNPR